MRLRHVELAFPAVLGLLLGPMAETQLRLAPTISRGDPVALVAN